jgi:hypothetical protein
MSYICAKRVETEYIKSGQMSLTSPLDISSGGTGCTTLSDIKDVLDIVIGTDIQKYSKRLSDIDELSLSNDDLISYDGSKIVKKSITNNIYSYYELKTINTRTSSPSVLCSIDIPNNSAISFNVMVSFCSESMEYSGGIQLYTSFKNVSGTVSQFDIGQTIIYRPSPSFTATMNNSGTVARVLVNAKTDAKVMWTCKMIYLVAPKYVADA